MQKGLADLKAKFIIPIFIPHYGCPHVCIFCDQKQITGQKLEVTGSAVTALLMRQLAGVTPGREIEVAFYGGSFTALSLAKQRELLAPAYEQLQAGNIHAIRLSTRPDYITAPILQQLRDYGVSTVELGVQSMDDKVLYLSERGHTAQQVREAVHRLKAAGFNVGIQLMPGLPGETMVSLLKTVLDVIALRPELVRIYPVVVFEKTRLADWYRAGKYQALTLDQAVAKAAAMQLLFKKHQVRVIRTGLQATDELDQGTAILDGPYHPALGELVTAYLYRQKIAAWLEAVQPIGTVILHIPPRHESKVRGQKNANVHYWEKQFSASICIRPDSPYLDYVSVEYHKIQYVFKL